MFTDESAVRLSPNDRFKYYPSDIRTPYIEIGGNLANFGRSNFGITVYGNGFVTSNIIDFGFDFIIDEEKAAELINYYVSKCE